MRLIVGGRDTGKTKILLEYAAKNNAVVITQNARALRVKAQAYGIDVDITDVNDLKQTLATRKIVIHELDKYIENFYKVFGIDCLAATLTEENNNNE